MSGPSRHSPEFIVFLYQRFSKFRSGLQAFRTPVNGDVIPDVSRDPCGDFRLLLG